MVTKWYDLDWYSYWGTIIWKQTIWGYKKQESEHQSVLCLNTELKTIFKMDKIDRKTLGWSVIY